MYLAHRESASAQLLNLTDTMDVFLASVLVATILCSLVGGFLFAFAVVAMPGLSTLEDGEFIRAFQAIDRVIQNNQPIFMLVWVGSAVALLIALISGVGQLAEINQMLLVAAMVVYVLGVQVPTMTINVPLNNRLQSHNVTALDEVERKAARSDFERRWNRWNVFRSVFASLTTALLVFLLVRL